MTSKIKFERLFQPGRIGTMEIKNRIVMSPMGTNYATKDGYVTERMKDYYEERAKGGVGLVITEVSCIDSPVGKAITHELAINDDKFIAGLSELARAIQKHGAKAIIQLHHAGREAHSRFTHHQPIAPSPVTFRWLEPPRELTTSEIKDLITRFAKGAERSKRAGFDGIEIHAAHGYLIAQFLSPAANKRQDEYGGTLENRARFLLEILQACRQAVGRTFPVWCRINGTEYMDNGLTLEEAKEVARMLQDAGTDAIHVSVHGVGPYGDITLPHPLMPGRNVHLAEKIKKVVNVPVIAVGRIEPELGERILQEEKADFVAVGRALIADPEFANKVFAGRLEDIRPCIGCLECLGGITFNDETLRCSVNPAVGRERKCAIRPTERKRKVMVVGGGPAGMEAARVAALRGHQVALYERDARLGGQLILAAKPPQKAHIDKLTTYLETQIRRLGVKVMLEKEVTSALIDEVKPEAVVLATGVIPLIPEISGIDRAEVVTAKDVLTGRTEVGKRVIIIGGNMVGCETAEFLANKGKEVTVVEMEPRMAAKMMPIVRRQLLDRLIEGRVTMLIEVKCESITSKTLSFVKKHGERQIIEADTIVLAAGSKPNTDLFKALKGKVPEIHVAGDCVGPRRILEATEEGYRAGLAVSGLLPKYTNS